MCVGVLSDSVRNMVVMSSWASLRSWHLSRFERGGKLIMGESILGSENSQFKDPRAGACLAHSRNSKGSTWTKCKGLKREDLVQSL